MLEKRLDAEDDASESLTEGFKTSRALEEGECAARHSLYDV